MALWEVGRKARPGEPRAAGGRDIAGTGSAGAGGRRTTAALALAALCLTTLAGCRASAVRSGARSEGPASVDHGSGTTPAHPSAGVRRVRVSVANWRLPTSLSREVALSLPGGEVEVAGGLTATGSSTTAVVVVDPRTGKVRSLAPLAAATHDAAGAVLRGAAVIFGGGQAGSVATVQRTRGDGRWQAAAALPRPRSDLAAVTVGGTAYLVGGYDGAAWDASVLATVDGSHFAEVTALPVPVRYPAVAATGNAIWIFGGQARSGPTDAIQRVDPASGRAAVVGHLRRPLTDAVALVLGGDVLLCGGRVGGVATATVTRFDPATLAESVAGALPAPIADAAGAVVADTGYLLGGEGPQPSSRVLIVRLVAVT